MLFLEHIDTIGGVRLVITTDIAPAWICYYPPSLGHNRGHDWRMYVSHKSDEPARSGKSATSLMIESRLRAWLLQHFCRRLSDLRFAELCQIAEQKLASGRNARLLERKRKLHIL
jgi:hypothetical protein